MGIRNHGGGAMGKDCFFKLRRRHHGTFNMYMPVNKTGTDIPACHIYVDKPIIFPYAGYAAILNGYVPNLCALRKYIDDCPPF